MKKLVSTFAVLLAIISSNYSQANEVSIQPVKPKAQNGAQDPSVKVLTEADSAKDKEKERVSRVKPQDLGIFRYNESDNQVVMFRQGNENVIMIPFRALKLNEGRKAIFEEAQIYGEKLMITWLERAINIRYPTQDEMVRQEIRRLSAAQLREILRKAPGTQPTTDEILKASRDAEEALRKLKADRKFLADFDELVAAYDDYQQNIVLPRGLKYTAQKAVPSAVLVMGSFKVPDTLIEAVKKLPVVKGLSALLKGSVNFTLALRPWVVVRQNLDTGVVSQSYHWETSPQAWITRDFTGRFDARSPFKLGAGFILGDFTRMADLVGGTIGASYTTPMNASFLGLPIPSNISVQAGAIYSLNQVKNTFIIASKQFGLAAAPRASFQGELGAMGSLESVTESIKFKPDTLSTLLKLLEDEAPGATITITKGEKFLSETAPEFSAKHPAEKESTGEIESQPETPAKP